MGFGFWGLEFVNVGAALRGGFWVLGLRVCKCRRCFSRWGGQGQRGMHACLPLVLCECVWGGSTYSSAASAGDRVYGGARVCGCVGGCVGVWGVGGGPFVCCGDLVGCLCYVREVRLGGGECACDGLSCRVCDRVCVCVRLCVRARACVCAAFVCVCFAGRGLCSGLSCRLSCCGVCAGYAPDHGPGAHQQQGLQHEPPAEPVLCLALVLHLPSRALL